MPRQGHNPSLTQTTDRRAVTWSVVTLLCAALVLAVRGAFAADDPILYSVASPNGQVRIDWSVTKTQTDPAQLRYRVFLGDRPVILSSALGVRFTDGTSLGSNGVVEKSEIRKIDTRFEQFPGKRRRVVDRCSEATLTLRERTPDRTWQVVVRAYDDGVALRYRFPKQPGWHSLDLAEERTEFVFPPDAVVTALPLESFTTSHEGRYQRQPVAELAADRLMGLPLLLELPGTGWAAVAEANLTNYAGMYLSKADAPRGAERATALVSRLSPPFGQAASVVRAPLPHESPWRVLIVANEAEHLVESDLVLKLNAPCAIDDISWIQPGQTTFPWWNGYYEENVPFTPGLNTATAKHYVDFCAEYRIPYHTLEGIDNTAWYGGSIVPYDGSDPTTAIDGLDLPEVLAYAKQKGVRLRLWMHWQAARDHMARAFPLYRRWGVEGVMIDFMDRNDQEMVNFQRALLQLAAENRLTVTFHGVAPPTGLERTYPNLLTSEAVMNLEYNKWDALGISPEHDVTVPLTRMLAGPLDYHQGSLRGIPPARYRPQAQAPLVIGTPCRMLASYVVFQNHLPMLADYPTAYRRHPLTRVLTQIPVTWDDTRAVSVQVGEHAAIARRSGQVWWIGAMTDSAARELAIPLDFLGPGCFRADIYFDDLSAPHQFATLDREVAATDVLPVRLAPAGGALIRIRKIGDPAPPGWRLVWSDDFDSLDDNAWEQTASLEPANRSLQAYLPQQVSAADGKLVIRSDNTPTMGLSYRSGQVTSRHAQRFGRWEVRAKIPAGRGIYPAIRLLPDAPWPSQGEIGIMESRGDRPTVTSSTFYWGSGSPLSPGLRAIEQRSSRAGKLVSFPNDFHTYAVEWLEDQLRFYVDDVYHTIFYSDEVGDFLPRLQSPMRLVIGTAIGGDSRLPPDASTAWPQQLLVDWVRVYESTGSLGQRRFVNGDFEANGGTLAGWHVFGNRLEGTPNVLVQNETALSGSTALLLSGQSSGGENYSGISQGITVVGGQRLRARLSARVPSTNTFAGTANRATMKIEFYNHWGDYFGGPAMLGVVERTIADRSTPTDRWQKHELIADAPQGACEARLSLVFAQQSDGPAAVCCDAVEFAPIEE